MICVVVLTTYPKNISPTPDPAPRGGEKGESGDFAAQLCRKIPGTPCFLPLLPLREKGQGMRVRIGGQTICFSDRYLDLSEN